MANDREWRWPIKYRPMREKAPEACPAGKQCPGTAFGCRLPFVVQCQNGLVRNCAAIALVVLGAVAVGDFFTDSGQTRSQRDTQQQVATDAARLAPVANGGKTTTQKEAGRLRQ